MTALKVGDVITTHQQLKTLPSGALLYDGDFYYLMCADGLVVDDCAMVRRRKSLYLSTTGWYPTTLVYLPEASS